MAHLESGGNAISLLDVRETFELSRGVLPQAVCIPMSELLERVAEIPADRPVVCYCEHGVRSYDVAIWLQQQGYSARSLAGGFAEWLGPKVPWPPNAS
ncbi:MAG: rhodanese-like domain-containing protein [Candidatus Sumerlaeaceae bacterium]